MNNYSIGEVSRKTKMNTSTIRYYEKNGLLPFVKRDAARRRQFSDVDLGYLEVIDCMKKSAISIKEIADFMDLCFQGDKSLQKRYDFLEDHEHQLEQRIKELQDNLEFLRWKKWYYQQALEAGSESINFIADTRIVDPKVKQRYETEVIHKKLSI